MPASSSRRGRPSRSCRTLRHPYTVGLMRCIPRGGLRKDRGKLDTIPGFLPPIGASLPGCVFVHRCGLAEEICSAEKPPDHRIGVRHQSRCHFHERAQQLPRDTASIPVERPTHARGETPLLSIDKLAKTFTQDGRDIKALAGVSASLGRGRRSASWASRAAARRRSPAPCSGSSSRLPAGSRSTAGRCRPGLRSGRRRTWPLCRSSSRTPIRPSTGGTRSAAC